MGQKTFNINEIRNFLNSNDSYGEIFFHLSEANISHANDAYQKAREDWKDDGENETNPYRGGIEARAWQYSWDECKAKSLLLDKPVTFVKEEENDDEQDIDEAFSGTEYAWNSRKSRWGNL